MSECLSPTGAFNQFSSLPSIPYAIIEKLMENGYAYETSTAIYFDVAKLDEYGIL